MRSRRAFGLVHTAVVGFVIKARGEGGLPGIGAIADAYRLIRQAHSAWTHEIDLRPFKEAF